MPNESADYLRYTPSVEQPTPDEHIIFDELSRTMEHINRTMAPQYRRPYLPAAAKPPRVLVGTLKIPASLPPHLAQGLFAQPGSHSVILRFSTNPGDMLADSVSSPRGLAIKVLGAKGEKVPGHEAHTTQDFVCVNANAFGAPDPAGFLKQIKQLDKTLAVPELVKEAVSTTARATNAVLKAVHLESAALEGIGAPATHILGESFSTVSPIRFGEYVAKLGFAPESENLKELTGKSVDLGADYNALELLIQHFFRHQAGTWAVKAQLALVPTSDKEDKNQDFPIERADKPWPEDKSPWQTVAHIHIPAQNSYSNPRQLFVDEQLSFTPWHALLDHQPLGGIMRSRLKAYQEAAKFRAQRNQRPAVEPTSITEIPD